MVLTLTSAPICYHQADMSFRANPIQQRNVLMSSMAWVKRCYSEKSKRSQ